MRPHFSVRVLLLITAVLALGCYWAFVRPTVVARQFVRAIEAGDYPRADLLFNLPDCRFLSDRIRKLGDVTIAVKMNQRGWTDISQFQQRMQLQIVPNVPEPGTNFSVGYQADVVATPIRIEPPTLYVVAFKR